MIKPSNTDFEFDLGGITLEFACWTKGLDERDTTTVPRTAADRRPPVTR